MKKETGAPFTEEEKVLAEARFVVNGKIITGIPQEIDNHLYFEVQSPYRYVSDENKKAVDSIARKYLTTIAANDAGYTGKKPKCTFDGLEYYGNTYGDTPDLYYLLYSIPVENYQNAVDALTQEQAKGKEKKPGFFSSLFKK